MIWDDEWNQNLLYMSNIACYPERWNTSIKSDQHGEKSEREYRFRKNKARNTASGNKQSTSTKQSTPPSTKDSEKA